MAVAYLVTRDELVERLRLELHQPSTGGAYKTRTLTSHLQNAIGRVWEDLTASEDGVGRVHENFTIAVGDPDGRVPGQSIPLPSDLLRLVRVARQGVTLRRGTPSRREFLSNILSTPALSEDGGPYWIDGPNQTVSGGAYTLSTPRLLVRPDFAAGEVVDWVYVQQRYGLVDPSDPDPDNPTVAVSIDLLSDAIIDAIVSLAATRATARDDASALQRALATAQDAISNYYKRKNDRDEGVQRLSDFRHGGSYGPFPW